MDKADDQLDFNFAADDLLELPRDLGESGYFQFSSERRQAIRALAEKSGLALNRRVRLRLRGCEEEFEGKLMFDSLLIPTLDEETIRLRLGKVTFDHTDIELCQILD